MDGFLVLGLFSLLAWLGLAILVGKFATDRGQNGAGWFLLALLTSPLIAGILLILLTPPRPPSAY